MLLVYPDSPVSTRYTWLLAIDIEGSIWTLHLAEEYRDLLVGKIIGLNDLDLRLGNIQMSSQ